MTAKVGTHSFTSFNSKEIEQRHRQMAFTILKNRPKWGIIYSLPLDKFIQKEYLQFCTKQNGLSNESQPDFGYLTYNDKIVGSGEIKYQDEFANACERAFKILIDLDIMGLKADRAFITVNGPGWIKNPPKATSTWPMVARCKAKGCTILVQPTDDEFRESFLNYIEKIEKEEENERN